MDPFRVPRWNRVWSAPRSTVEPGRPVPTSTVEPVPKRRAPFRFHRGTLTECHDRSMPVPPRNRHLSSNPFRFHRGTGPHRHDGVMPVPPWNRTGLCLLPRWNRSPGAEYLSGSAVEPGRPVFTSTVEPGRPVPTSTVEPVPKRRAPFRFHRGTLTECHDRSMPVPPRNRHLSSNPFRFHRGTGPHRHDGVMPVPPWNRTGLCLLPRWNRSPGAEYLSGSAVEPGRPVFTSTVEPGRPVPTSTVEPVPKRRAPFRFHRGTLTECHDRSMPVPPRNRHLSSNPFRFHRGTGPHRHDGVMPVPPWNRTGLCLLPRWNRSPERRVPFRFRGGTGPACVHFHRGTGPACAHFHRGTGPQASSPFPVPPWNPHRVPR